MSTKKIKVIEVQHFEYSSDSLWDDVETRIISLVDSAIDWVEVSQQEYEDIHQAINMINSERPMRPRYFLISDSLKPDIKQGIASLLEEAGRIKERKAKEEAHAMGQRKKYEEQNKLRIQKAEEAKKKRLERKLAKIQAELKQL